MITNTFTVRLIDQQPVYVTDPESGDYTFDVHQDIVIKGEFNFGFNDLTGGASPVLKIIFPDETIVSMKRLLSAGTITLTPTVTADNTVVIAVAGG